MPDRSIISLPAALAAALAAQRADAGAAYRIIDLTELAQPIGVVQCEARGINAAGEAVGFEVVGDFIERAIRWDADGTAHLLHQLLGDNSALALDIEDDGSILGLSELVEISMCGPLICITETQKATMWSGNTLADLNSLVTGGDTTFDLEQAWDRDGAGRIVGFGRTQGGPPFEPRGFLLDAGIVTNLGTLARPVAINELNQIVGWSGSGQDHAWLWDGGTLVSLHDDAAIGGVTSRCFGINDAGLIVGEAQFEISDPEEPAAWIDRAAFKLVPEIARPQGVATAVNASGQVVGFYNDLDILNSPFEGFLWQDGSRIQLLDVIHPALGWQVLYPFAINEQGWIAGGGVRNGQLGHGFLMKPVAACPWDLDADGSVGVVDLLALLAEWGGDPGGPPDFDGDGDVGVLDLLSLLAHWGPCA